MNEAAARKSGGTWAKTASGTGNNDMVVTACVATHGHVEYVPQGAADDGNASSNRELANEVLLDDVVRRGGLHCVGQTAAARA